MRVIKVWEEVVNTIITKIVEYSEPEMNDLHINIREEMAFELAKIIIMLQERIVDDRINERSIESIDPQVERAECFSDHGVERIRNTAKNIADGYYLELYRTRWGPKSQAALAKENSPTLTRIFPKPVEKNHFIPKSFIKKYWSENQSVFRNQKNTSLGFISMKPIPLGSWGYRHNLYTDYLEAYFSLVEGDAVMPIDKILNGVPLNGPQRNELLGFIVIQYLRNPLNMQQFRGYMEPVVAAYVGGNESQDDNYMKKVYESLYSQNEIYDKIARSILWSKWALVWAKNPVFVLPDVSVVFGFHNGGRYVIMPLTPSCCLVVLPVRVSELRVVPYNIRNSEELANDISNTLIHASSEEFLSVKEFQHELTDMDSDATINRIFDLLKILTSEEP